MAPSSFLLLRRPSPLNPLAACSLESSSSALHIHNRLFTSRFQPFSTSSDMDELYRLWQRAFFDRVTGMKLSDEQSTASDKNPILDGLPFDSIQESIHQFDYAEEPEHRTLTLGRKTKDEIIKIKLCPERDSKESNRICYTDDGLPRLSIDVKILYGNNFNRCFELHVVTLT